MNPLDLTSANLDVGQMTPTGTARGLGELTTRGLIDEGQQYAADLESAKRMLEKFRQQASQQKKRQMFSDILGTLATVGTMGLAGPIAGATGLSSGLVSAAAPSFGSLIGRVAGGGQEPNPMIGQLAGSMEALNQARGWKDFMNTYIPTTQGKQGPDIYPGWYK